LATTSLQSFLTPQEYESVLAEKAERLLWRVQAGDLRLSLPEPHPLQRALIESTAKRRVVISGRRGGKTTGVAILSARLFQEGRRVLYAAPTEDQTSAYWETMKEIFSVPIASRQVYKNETRRLIESPTARIRAKTAWDADSLRGDYADLLILEEWAYMDPSAWDQVGAPMLLDNNGDAVFIFTPRRKNHAHRTYLQAKADDTGRWAYWHFTSHDNPHLSTEALAELTADMTDENYRQEIMAEFLEDEGAVFRNVREACILGPGVPGEHKDHSLVLGVDWGKQHDYTAISVGCASCRVEVALDRFNKIDYAFQRARLAVLHETWPGSILAESNAMGEPVIEELQRAGLPVSGFQTTAASKPPLIENLALALERGEWRFLADDSATAELEAYERTVSARTGRPSYGAPEGMHDDTVMARALMLWRQDSWLLS